MKNDASQDDSEKIKRIVKEFLKLEKPTPEIMKVIINRIEIYQDKQVDIIFNFKNLQRHLKSGSKNLHKIKTVYFIKYGIMKMYLYLDLISICNMGYQRICLYTSI